MKLSDDVRNNRKRRPSSSREEHWLWLTVVFITTCHHSTDGVCTIPDHFRGDYYSIDHGVELRTLVNDEMMSNEMMQTAYCEKFEYLNGTEDAQGHFDIKLVLHNQDADCFQCLHMNHRTINVIQYRQTSCVSRNLIGSDVQSLCSQILPHTDVITMFRIALKTVNCHDTFEGTFQFTYEIDYGGGGICDSSNSIISACQEPGSVYTDNQVFRMKFATCDEVQSSVNMDIRFQCMGSWMDENQNIYSAMADIGRDQYRERFRCMLTRRDQELDNSLRFSLSRWASCSSLKSPYEGPIRLLLKPVLSGLQLVSPTCFLPRNYSGRWYKGGEYDTYIDINSTHLYFTTGYSQYTYRETIFTCIMNRDQRYMVSVVNVGKCEMDYMCFDFVPRHHSIIRWRLSRSIPTNIYPSSDPHHMERAFRDVCAWSRFTYDSSNPDWMYSYFIMMPPTPYPCPIGGRYSFTQTGLEEEKYYTRVRGITERPRHNIDCQEYTSEIRSCPDNPTKMKIDVEYCATLDHTGKPIGEYEIADREMICAGYWQEDMKSYLITYDDEDPMSGVRCWVYERSDWRTISMARSSSPLCSSFQTAWSTSWEDLISVQLQLTESERLWDSCPQRYDTGTNPWEQLSKVYVLDRASQTDSSSSLLVIIFTASSLIRLLSC